METPLDRGGGSRHRNDAVTGRGAATAVVTGLRLEQQRESEGEGLRTRDLEKRDLIAEMHELKEEFVFARERAVIGVGISNLWNLSERD
ncbi:hypothetical protein AAHA92_06312 [Salvia divinorum]|uniref:Uncharacterized protein n=1 Tax=Salvia divinorum TaxID=28513 RepID=A0ABD1I590_SALDI